jgi:hypothetical protein
LSTERAEDFIVKERPTGLPDLYTEDQYADQTLPAPQVLPSETQIPPETQQTDHAPQLGLFSQAATRRDEEEVVASTASTGGQTNTFVRRSDWGVSLSEQEFNILLSYFTKDQNQKPSAGQAS